MAQFTCHGIGTVRYIPILMYVRGEAFEQNAAKMFLPKLIPLWLDFIQMKNQTI